MKRYIKAITAAGAAGLTSLVAALADGTVTGDEWWKVLTVTVVTGVAVWRAPANSDGAVK